MIGISANSFTIGGDMFNTFEASGNMDDWPANEPGKATQAAVFGLRVTKENLKCEILWTGKFPDLEKAMYWAAKKEVQTIRTKTWDAASRVLWQHDLTPEQAVEASRRQLEPQFVRSIRSAQEGNEPELGEGPLKPVDLSKVEGVYFEVEGPDGKDAVPPFFIPLETEEEKSE
jgi:hypothetical protein